MQCAKLNSGTKSQIRFGPTLPETESNLHKNSIRIVILTSWKRNRGSEQFWGLSKVTQIEHGRPGSESMCYALYYTAAFY